MRNLLGTVILVSILSLLPLSAYSQFQFDTKTLLEEYSLEMFETNAAGFMGPLVIVSNVGANDGFYNSAYVPYEDRLSFKFSVKAMYAGVRDDQKTYTAYLPLTNTDGESISTRVFKEALRQAVAANEIESSIETATVFGGEGAGFTIPKQFIIGLGIPGLDEDALNGVPDELPLTRGTNQEVVFAAVPQLEIGTYKHTQFLVRYIPPIEFDTAVGDFSFVGVGLKHGFTNWMKNPPFNAAFQISYQHSTINNRVGDTQAELDAATDMFSMNVHASRRFEVYGKHFALEPYLGISYEHLRSSGTYTFVLPRRLSMQLGYDIDPQTAHIDLSDDAVKLTLGLTFHLPPAELNIGMGISKHLIFGAGLGVYFDPPFMDQD